MSTLLIADDSADKRLLLKSLAAHHWSGLVVEAATTEAAMAAIASSPDLAAALIDYYIPSQNGPALIRAVRAAFPHAKIALVSSSDNPDNAREARAAGADDIVCTGWPEAPKQIADLLTAWTDAAA